MSAQDRRIQKPPIHVNPEPERPQRPERRRQGGITVNLHARDDFNKGDTGYAAGHQVTRAPGVGAPVGMRRVTALQAVKAGMNGWFEVRKPK